MSEVVYRAGTTYAATWSDFSRFGVVQKPLSAWERIYNQAGVRKTFILVLLAVIWEVYARLLDNPLLFPTFTATIHAFIDGIVGGGLLGKAWTSIKDAADRVQRGYCSRRLAYDVGHHVRASAPIFWKP